MTKEEIRFQCFRETLYHEGSMAASASQTEKNRKSIDEIIIDAQKIYDWVIKEG